MRLRRAGILHGGIQLAGILLCVIGMASADAQIAGEPSHAELLDLVRRLERQVGAQGEQIHENQAEIERLRAALATAQLPGGDSAVDLATDDPAFDETEDGDSRPRRIAVKSDEKGLISLRLGGRIEVEWVDVENERHSPAGMTELPNGYFQVDKVRLSVDARATENVHAVAQLDFSGDLGAGLDQAFVEFDHLPARGRLSIGRRRRFIAMNRRIESYPLLAEAFWRARDVGLQGEFSVGDLTVHGSLTNGLTLRTRIPNEDLSFPTIVDGSRNFDFGHAKELGVGLEYDLELGEEFELEAMAFAYFGRLDDDDLDLLAAIQDPTPTMDRDKRFYGFNVELDWYDFEVQAQFISADEGADLDRLGWTIQPSWDIDLPGIDAFGSTWLTSVRPLFRYGTLRNDFEARAADSLTWNRKAYTAALVLDITNHTELYIEQTWNVEEPHRFGVRNDQFLVQLRMSW